MLRHRNCGGEVVEDPNTEPYEYDANENGNPCKISAYRCRKCSVEILGDSQVILEGYDEAIDEKLGRNCE